MNEIICPLDGFEESVRSEDREVALLGPASTRFPWRPDRAVRGYCELHAAVYRRLRAALV